MWNTAARILFLTLLVKQTNGAQLSTNYCAYKRSEQQLSIADGNHGNDDTTVAAADTTDTDSRFDLRDYISKISGGYVPVVRGRLEQCQVWKGGAEGVGDGGYCVTVWGSGQDVVMQGCWIKHHVDACITESCSYARSRSVLNNTLHFCCCRGDRCNVEDDDDEVVPAVINSGAASGTAPEGFVPTPPPPHTTSLVQQGKDPSESPRDFIKCAYRRPEWMSGKRTQGQVQADGRTMHCDPHSSFCFSYYTLESDDNGTETMNLQYQGCWYRDPTCNTSACVPQSKVSHKTNLGESQFCCCTGDFCNNNISTSAVAQPRTTTAAGPGIRQIHDPSYKQRTVLISILSVLSLAIIILASYLLYRYCFHNPHTPDCNHDNNLNIPESPAFDIDDLKISCLISRGHFSEVWKGSLNDGDVAVKIYNNKNKQYYYNEKYIYSLPHMVHESVLKFYGGEERIMQDGNTQYLLVLQYVPEGTLMNYLKNNTLDWYTMCKMCQSLAKGIAHLHTDMGCADEFKPTVAHRDLNSRNVLVMADLSLVVADLGFCMTAQGSKLIHKGHTENAEQTSLTDVGTLRYMAPELLDGAVNLRDCEASLKQIDMYSFGLVMWEIATRCSDLYQGCPIPEFALPFQAEAGSPPSFEEMQLLVSRNKIRPKFPEVWKDYNQAIRALKETIEECWDHDAEARLTSMCVEERIIEMKMLWSHDSRNKGVTPTINTALLSQNAPSNRNVYHGNGHTYWGGLGSTSESSPSVVAEGSTSALIINDIHNHVPNTTTHSNIQPGESTGGSTNLPPSWATGRSGSFSTSTMDTTIAPTPSEPPPVPPVPPGPKSQNINTQRNQPLPPHQGRNPTAERNTHKRSDEELAVVGNNLLYGKEKRDGEGIQSPVANSDIFDSLTDSLETSLMQNDILNQHRSPQISYLQNQVHPNAGRHGELPPKVVNNPNQRTDNTHQVTQSQTSVPQNTSTPKIKKAKEMGLLGHLALLGKLAFGGKFDSGRKNQNDSEQGSVAIRAENGTVYDSIGQRNPVFEPSQSMDTEVRLTNGGPVVRPMNLRVKQPPSVVSNRELSHSNLDKAGGVGGPGEGSEGRTDEVGEGEGQAGGEVADVEREEKEPFLSSAEFTRLTGAPYSKSTSDLSPQKSCAQLRLEEEIKRPSTLSLKGHNYNKLKSQPGGSLNSLSVFKGGHRVLKDREKTNGYRVLASKPLNTKAQPTSTSQLPPPSEVPADKIKLRNKTPTEKRGRLSLYDDRLMSEGDQVSDENTNMRKCSMSLQQFKSIDETSTSVYTDCTC